MLLFVIIESPEYYMYKPNDSFHSSTLSYNDAKSYCQNMGLRLPKTSELSSLFSSLPTINPTQSGQKICHKEYEQNFIWSESSTYGVNICSGEQKTISSSVNRSVFCVSD